MHVPMRETKRAAAVSSVAGAGPAVAVLGAGSWGTALAAASRRAGLPTRLWSRRPDVAHAIRSTGCNPRHLPGIMLPAGLQASDDLQWALQGADVVLYAVPSSALRKLATLAAGKLPGHALAVATCKGVEAGSGALMTEVLRQQCPAGQPVGVLAGASFADEVARGQPTCLTLAVAAAPAGVAALVRQLAQAWRGAGIELESCADEIGVQVAGALKNAVAIACGMASAQGLGENARATIVSRGLADMRRLLLALGGRSDSLFCSSGVADLFLTASSSHSRNTRLGLRLGAGAQAAGDGAEEELAEGALASHALLALERRLHVVLQVPRAVRQVLGGHSTPALALRQLLSGRAEPAASPQRAGHASPPRLPGHEPAALRLAGAAWAHRVAQ